MRNTIWKYEVPVGADSTVVDVPQGGRIVHVACQGTIVSRVCVWIEVDPSNAVEGRRFCIVGTGHPIPDGEWSHVGTALPHAQPLVWHVYEHRPVVDESQGPTLAETDPDLIQHLMTLGHTYGLTGIRNACQALIDAGKF